MKQKIKSLISRNLINARGWRTNRKIVVFESDDWGSIRMPNKHIYNKLIKSDIHIENDPYCKYDTLANTDDLSLLFETLLKFKDANNNSPLITFNTVMANPDFGKIENSGFTKYYYEPFTETLLKYYPNQKVFNLWQEGIEKKMIKPQFHGREHVNAPLWLRELRNNHKELRKAFEMGCWGIPKSNYGTHIYNIQASYFTTNTKLEFYKQNIIEGLILFKSIFRVNAKTFIANNYTFPDELLKTLYESGIIGIQSMKYQKIPKPSNSYSLKKVYTGKKNDLDQIYTVRNCIFEPSQQKESFDNVGNCLKEIANAFLWNKPAIITSHRLNFIGQLEEKNRIQNLKMLSDLLKKIVEIWPNVEFMSSDDLVTLIKNE